MSGHKCYGKSLRLRWRELLHIKMGVLFHIHFWDQSNVTIVWNTRETGDINIPFEGGCETTLGPWIVVSGNSAGL